MKKRKKKAKGKLVTNRLVTEMIVFTWWKAFFHQFFSLAEIKMYGELKDYLNLPFKTVT